MDSSVLHRTVLDGFGGPYSLGIGKDQASSAAVLVLMVPDGVVRNFPTEVQLNAEPVKVMVQRGFRAPSPLQQPNAA